MGEGGGGGRPSRTATCHSSARPGAEAPARAGRGGKTLRQEVVWIARGRRVGAGGATAVAKGPSNEEPEGPSCRRGEQKVPTVFPSTTAMKGLAARRPCGVRRWSGAGGGKAQPTLKPDLAAHMEPAQERRPHVSSAARR